MADISEFLTIEDSDDQGPTQYALIPTGDYIGEIASAEMRTTSKGGKMIALKIRLDSGRIVFDNLNVLCPSSGAAETIARKSLATIRNSNPSLTMREESDMIGMRVAVRVDVRPPQNGYDAQNIVRWYNDARTTRAPVRDAAPASRTADRAAVRDFRAEQYEARVQDKPAASAAKKWGRKVEEIFNPEEIPF